MATPLSNAIGSLPGLYDMIGTICFGSGLIMMAMAIHSIIEVSGQRGGHVKPSHITAEFVAGILLISASTFLSFVEQTLFGSSSISTSSEILSYASANATISQSAQILNAYMRWAQFIGIVAYVRGLFMIRAIGRGESQGGSFGNAAVFIFGGAMAANIVLLLNILHATFGVGPGQ